MFRQFPGIHLIFFSTNSLPVQLLSGVDPFGLRWLSDEERQRHDRYRSPAKRQEFLATRLHGRAILSQWLEIPVESISWNACGRPEIRANGTAISQAISIAHASGYGVLAISEGIDRIGVDIECEQETRPAGLEQTFLTKSEIDELDEFHADDRAESVLDRWLIKEAAYKCLSETTLLAPDEIQVSSQRHKFTGQRYQIELSGIQRKLSPQILSICSGKVLTSSASIDTNCQLLQQSISESLRTAVVCDNGDFQDELSEMADGSDAVKTWFHSENSVLYVFESSQSSPIFV